MKILIIDIETTGFLPKGKLLEVGIVRLNLKNGKRKILYSKVINPLWTREKLEKEAWPCQNGWMEPNEILLGEKWEDVKDEVQAIIDKYPNGATAYNRKFDMTFLQHYGITFPKLLPCPMLLSTPICNIPGKWGKPKWPKVEEAYDFFFPKNEYKEIHRGGDDAMHEAEIVYAIHLLNKFLPTIVIRKGGFKTNEN